MVFHAGDGENKVLRLRLDWEYEQVQLRVVRT